jgi:MFS family permease
MIVLIESLNLGYVLPLIESECEMQISLSQKGFLNGAVFFGIIVSSPFWGFLADVWGRKNVLFLCTGLNFLVSTLTSFSTNIWMLIIFKFLSGIL